MCRAAMFLNQVTLLVLAMFFPHGVAGAAIPSHVRMTVDDKAGLKSSLGVYVDARRARHDVTSHTRSSGVDVRTNASSGQA